MKYIDDVQIQNKRILLRVDFNVPFTKAHKIADDERIRAALPTIEYLLKKNNTIILVSHLDNPSKRDLAFSLKPVALKLKRLLPSFHLQFIDDFLTDRSVLTTGTQNIIYMLENVRFYPQEQQNDESFAKQLASLADVYVNDAFSVCHRREASIVSIPTLLPSYGGLLLKKEITALTSLLNDPKRPMVAVMGGSKISTKLSLLKKLMRFADTILVGGGLANNFLASRNISTGKSLVDTNELQLTKELLATDNHVKATLQLPFDVMVSESEQSETADAVSITAVPDDKMILDIGPKTQETFANTLSSAKTIIWNGPVGYIENPTFTKGTDTVFTAIVTNDTASSIVGGGDTLRAIAHKPERHKITHISTGGGAMLDFIANGTLPGINALEKAR